MWLINTKTLELENQNHHVPHNYAILSHTWGDDEVLYSDYRVDRGKTKAGYRKIKFLCEQAREDGYRYAWIDTACIDKSSSSELSEAINSMFTWYRDSAVCYAYLEDVVDHRDLKQSRWFQRGWTLQELLAPLTVRFYSHSWIFLGSKESLKTDLAQHTGINVVAIESHHTVHSFSVATRMSWAAHRETTRPEDMAYCLLGLFKINIPLLYGEGRTEAFYRLQNEIFERTGDHSIFVWNRTEMPPNLSEIAFAPFPRVFDLENKVMIRYSPTSILTRPQSNGRVLPMRLRIVRKPNTAMSPGATIIAVLNCRFEGQAEGYIGVQLRTTRRNGVNDKEEYFIFDDAPVETVSGRQLAQATIETIFVHKGLTDDLPDYHRPFVCFLCTVKVDVPEHKWYVQYAGPDHGNDTWNQKSLTSEVTLEELDDPMIRKFIFVHHDDRDAFAVWIMTDNPENAQFYVARKNSDEDLDSFSQRQRILEAADLFRVSALHNSIEFSKFRLRDTNVDKHNIASCSWEAPGAVDVSLNPTIPHNKLKISVEIDRIDYEWVTTLRVKCQDNCTAQGHQKRPLVYSAIPINQDKGLR